MDKKIPAPALRRLPKYYSIICEYLEKDQENIKSVEIARRLDVDETQVRKDISVTGYAGKPKIGFNTKELKKHLEVFLGLNSSKEAFLVGVGNLGLALAKYNGFKRYGLDIVGLFDTDPHKVGIKVGDREVFHISEFGNYAEEKEVKIAILAIPADQAQKMADIAIRAGMKAIWNFAPISIEVPKDIVISNQDLAADFITFSMKLAGGKI